MSDNISFKLTVITFYALASFWIYVEGICDVNVDDGTWSNFTFCSLPNDTSQGQQCEDIITESDASIFVLRIISENSLKPSRCMITSNDSSKPEVFDVTMQGIVKFINSSFVRVCCNKDNIRKCDLHMFYTELRREMIRKTFKEDNGLIQTLPYCPNGRYRPNAVSFWGIEARNGSVKLAMEKLDVDDYAGDFLLIGSSVTHYGNTSDVFQGPPPLFLTGKAKKQNIIVSTTYQSQVYLVLVSKTMERPDASGFTIRFQASGERIGPASTEKPAPTVAASWREAISVCATVPKNDSNEMVNSTVVSFMVDSVIEQMRRDPDAKPITRSQIKVVILAGQRRQKDEYFILLTVESWDHPNVPLLEANELRRMFNFGRISSPPGYTIMLCDQIPVAGEWLNSVALAFVPIFLFFLLLLWWFRYKHFWSSMVRNNEKNPTFQLEMFPAIMTNPAFVPDSPSEEAEFPQFFPDQEAKKNKLDPNNKDSGFASCSTHPSSAKSTPGVKRKVLFNVTQEEEQEGKPEFNVKIDENEEESDNIRL